MYEELKSSDEAPCKGRFYRGRVSFYGTAERLTETLKLIYLKRRSCKGCQDCEGGMGLEEHIRMVGLEGMNIGDIREGGLYRLAVTNIHRDWETGDIDEWDYEFTEVKEDA